VIKHQLAQYSGESTNITDYSLKISLSWWSSKSLRSFVAALAAHRGHNCWIRHVKTTWL